MTRFDEFSRISIVFVTMFWLLTFKGASCQLMVFPVGSSRVTSAAGDNVTLAISFSGTSDPTVAWFMENLSVVVWTVTSATPPVVAESLMKVVRLESNGSLTLLNVTLNYTSNYTVEMTKPGLSKAVTSFTLTVFERPAGDPVCFIQTVNRSSLQYECQWPGGVPQANLTFPQLNSTSSGVGNFSLSVPAFTHLDGKAVTCNASHPTEAKTCTVTARSPADFLPAVRITPGPDNQTWVSISCVSAASPEAAVTWSRGGAALTNGTVYQMSSDATQIRIRVSNVSSLLLLNYSCTCFNPLGNRTRDVQLLGPSISPSTLVCNKDGTSVALSWETPPASVVTGFDIQMMGSDTNSYSTVGQEPGSARAANISALSPHLAYRFRVVPKALMIEGAPSMDCKVGQSNGPVVAGLAAGIPCSLVLLLLLGGLIYLYVHCSRKKSRQPRYPKSRSAEKAVTSSHSVVPRNHMRRGGLRCPPDYNTSQQTPSERSVSLPRFAPPPPVRVATTV
ncbi:V-set and immunoglobulin domain-containing protein 10-like isoform X2 [Betta splendens]|uniref:V-set and immunoglobulin domain-containing protein 10-like isoform X2 n=1 Tax=Betta splendens TaxID=158456 RepID=UPI0010FA1C1F|nr:V-set and immunoglobulin domain-containing protein 10-like isoform X2 [Betta splendens]